MTTELASTHEIRIVVRTSTGLESMCRGFSKVEDARSTYEALRGCVTTAETGICLVELRDVATRVVLLRKDAVCPL